MASIKLTSREIIKPSSPTPNNHPSLHNLSIFDQLQGCIYVPFLFIYKAEKGEADHHRSSVLKNSLSATLSDYYPLAGRIKDHTTVDCNDNGVLFLEARMESDLSQVILKNPDDEIRKLLFPDSLHHKDSTLAGPVAVQVTYFQCGGMSIGLCLCHKILDAESMSSFILKWSSVARKSDQDISPKFNIGSLYPTFQVPFLKQPQPDMKYCVSRRLVFNGEMIAKLKAIGADQVPNPTRVEAVTSLLYKSAISAASKTSSSGSFMRGVMCHAMNLRPTIPCEISKGLTGNLFVAFPVSIANHKDVDLVHLMKEFREEKVKLSSICAKTFNDKEEFYSFFMESLKRFGDCFSGGNGEVYYCSSWCRFPFYEADFGWGKPSWVTTVGSLIKNVIIILDTKGGDGIEAFICLEEKVMAVFEQDQELLSFCTINPCVDGDILPSTHEMVSLLK